MNALRPQFCIPHMGVSVCSTCTYIHLCLCRLVYYDRYTVQNCHVVSHVFVCVQVCCVDRQENGHYPGHMFVLMVIHFLQQINVLPVLHEVSKLSTFGGSAKFNVHTISSCMERRGRRKREAVVALTKAGHLVLRQPPTELMVAQTDTEPPHLGRRGVGEGVWSKDKGRWWKMPWCLKILGYKMKKMTRRLGSRGKEVLEGGGSTR